VIVEGERRGLIKLTLEVPTFDIFLMGWGLGSDKDCDDGTAEARVGALEYNGMVINDNYTSSV